MKPDFNVIYCRVSTLDQNCDRQERNLLEYAAKAGYEVVGIFKETTSGAKSDRKERKLEKYWQPS